ncbi:tellurite resistance TerB family protein [Imhoffiella purpurea]|nr:tellurite resistance TerB family protein [Imhoffiella purpurea]
MTSALEDLQSTLASGASGQSAGGDMLGSLLGAAREMVGGASQNPLQAGGLGAALGSVLGGGGDSVRGALAGGALAMLASVAMKALSNSGQPGEAEGIAAAPVRPVPSSSVPEPVAPLAAGSAADDRKAELIIKGMINIAKSDGQVDMQEIQRIAGKAETVGMGPEDQAWLMEELHRPLDLDAFVAEIPNPEWAAEIYAASLLAVEIDTQAERDYLVRFAAKTHLHPLVVQHIHQSLGVAL